MDLARLSERFKRAADWQNALTQECADSGKRLAFYEDLIRYRGELNRIWSGGLDDAQVQQALEDLERELDDLFEQLRLSAA